MAVVFLIGGRTMAGCSYEEGMFAHEDLASDAMLRDFQIVSVLDAAAHHEAGHAVVSYALGHGCSRIELRELRQGDSVSHGGVAFGCKAMNSKVNAQGRRFNSAASSD